MQQTLLGETRLFAKRHVHLAVTGSVACYRSVDLVRALKHLGLFVSVVLSKGAREFVTPLLFEALGAAPVYTDMFGGEEVFAHLEPGERAEVMVVCPASAESIMQLRFGSAEELFSAQALAFAGPLLIAPAMNPRMYAAAAVQENLAVLQQRGALLLEPEEGLVACGEVGKGRLVSVEQILYATVQALAQKDFLGKKVLVTLGATREFLDDVRFLSNPSTGRMGASLALALWLRGAKVYALCGPSVALTLPQGVHRIDVTNALDMHQEAMRLWPQMDFGICTAAVADYRAKEVHQGKLKKEQLGEQVAIPLERNPDILMSLSRQRKQQKILAFAAETTPDVAGLIPLAKEKCLRKGADLLAANRVNSQVSGFGVATNEMVVVDRSGQTETWPLAGKFDLAWRLLTWLLQIKA